MGFIGFGKKASANWAQKNHALLPQPSPSTHCLGLKLHHEFFGMVSLQHFLPWHWKTYLTIGFIIFKFWIQLCPESGFFSTMFLTKKVGIGIPPVRGLVNRSS
jgi:hypothetical protein